VLERRTLLPLLAALVLAVPAPAQDATLEWKLPKGKSFYQTMSTSTTQNMKVQGSDVVQKQEQTFFFKWEVSNVDTAKNTVTLKQKIIGLKMNIDIGGSKIAYDSTAKDANTNNPLNKFFEALNDTEFTLTLNTKDMKVTNIEGHEAFVKKLTEANQQMKPLLDRILSKKALQDMAEPLFAALPGGKVSKGKEWKRTADLDMGPIGKYTTTYTYTYDGPDKDKNDKISVKTDLKYTPPTDKDAGGLPFKIKDAKLEGKDATGTIIYDPKNGWVKSSEMNLTLNGSLTIEIGQQSTTVELNQTQKTVVVTSDKDPTAKKQ
jgi:hypothetical protein